MNDYIITGSVSLDLEYHVKASSCEEAKVMFDQMVLEDEANIISQIQREAKVYAERND